MDTEQPKFGKWRSILWPIHRHELVKLLPMLLIFFLISFNYNILRTTKDVLIITAPGSGAQVIPFIKVAVMFPMALLITYIFSRISQTMSRENTFYVMNAIFLGYFAIFAVFLYPNKEAMQPDDFCNWLSTWLPVGYNGLVSMIRYWVYTTFYVMSELWGTAIMAVSFWGFANEVTRVDEAKRFYGLFGIGANMSGLAAGNIAFALSSREFDPSIPFGNTSWDQSLFFILASIMISGALSLILFSWVNKKIFNDEHYASIHEVKADGPKPVEKRKTSLKKDLQYLMHSPYMLAIAVIVLSFGFVINATEVMWKHEVSLLYPNPKDYSIYMNQVMMWIAVLATITAFLFTGNLIRQAGWTKAALVTPIVLLITSVGFFGMILFPEYASFALSLGWSPLAITVLLGTTQNCLSRTAKYTVFDATKELSFIPLDRHIKLKGKAVIDGVISRMGKSGASVLYTMLFSCIGSLTECAPYVGTFLILIIFVWIFAVHKVGKEFEELDSSLEANPMKGLQIDQAK